MEDGNGQIIQDDGGAEVEKNREEMAPTPEATGAQAVAPAQPQQQNDQTEDLDCALEGWSMKEQEYQQQVQLYFNRLDQKQLESFAPIKTLIHNSMQGYDLHILAWKPIGARLDARSIRGLVIFN